MATLAAARSVPLEVVTGPPFGCPIEGLLPEAQVERAEDARRNTITFLVIGLLSAAATVTLFRNGQTGWAPSPQSSPRPSWRWPSARKSGLAAFRRSLRPAGKTVAGIARPDNGGGTHRVRVAPAGPG